MPETEGQAPTTTPAAPAAAAPQTGQEPASQAPSSGSTDWTVESLPEGAQKLIRDLRAESGKHRDERNEARGKVREFEDRDKTDTQRLTDENSDLKTELASFRRRVIAAEAGLPADWASRLVGETEEELVADAKALAEQLGGQGGQAPAVPSFDGGARPNGAVPGATDMNALLRGSRSRA